MNQSGQCVDEVHQHRPIKEIILDMDSSDSPTFGRQEGSAYNGHFGYTCYHPLFVFNHLGDIERVLLRKGNVYNSHDWKSVLEPIMKRYQAKILSVISVGTLLLPILTSTAFLKWKITSICTVQFD